MEHYKSWSEVTGNAPNENMTNIRVATWGMSDEGKALVQEYYNWMIAKILPDTVNVNGSFSGGGSTGDAYVLNGRTDTQVPIGITFTVPSGWIFKSQGTDIVGEKEVTAYRQQQFTFVLSDSMQQLNPSSVPSFKVTGKVSGSPDESWKAIITSGKKEGTGGYQDLGGISYSQLSTSDTTAEISASAKRGNITILKTDEKGSALSGAKFGLYYDVTCKRPLVNGMESTPLVTGANGQIQASFLMTDTLETTQKIYVKELVAPAGYILNSKVYTVSLNNGSGALTVENETVTGTLKVYKSGEVLSGIHGENEREFEYSVQTLTGTEFALYARNNKNTPVRTLVMDENGYAEAKEIPLGEYILKETKAPAGYVLDTTEYFVTFTQKDDSTKEIALEQKIINVRQKLKVTIEKVTSADQKSPVSGAKFGLYNKEQINCNETIVAANTLLETAISDMSGKAVFNVDLPLGNYYVKDGVIVVKDKKLEVSIAKVDSDNPEDLVSGAEMVLYGQDKDGEYTVELYKWVTDAENNCDVSEYVKAGHSYVIKETDAPLGYAYAEEVPFKVFEDGSLEIEEQYIKDGVIIVVDQKFELNIAKVDSEDHTIMLEGAELTIFGQDENGEYTVEIHTWITEKDYILDVSGYLKAGHKYILRETKAPEGYEYADDISFEILEDGTIISDAETLINEDGVIIYLMEDMEIFDPPTTDEDIPGTPDTPEEDIPEEDIPEKDTPKKDTVKTGDDAMVVSWSIMMILALVIVVCLLRKRYEGKV